MSNTGLTDAECEAMPKCETCGVPSELKLGPRIRFRELLDSRCETCLAFPLRTYAFAPRVTKKEKALARRYMRYLKSKSELKK